MKMLPRLRGGLWGALIAGAIGLPIWVALIMLEAPPEVAWGILAAGAVVGAYETNPSKETGDGRRPGGQ